MSNKEKKTKKKKQKEVVEKNNINKIQKIKEEDKTRRNNKKAKRARERVKKDNIDNKETSTYKEEINLSGEDLLKDVSEDTNFLETNEKNENENSENSNNDSKCEIDDKIKLPKKIKILFFIIIAFLIIVLGILIFLALRPKFKDITIELGTTEISAEDFLVSTIYKNGASVVTDLNSINFLTVQEIEVALDFKGKQETVKLNIVDTTPPKVTFKNMMAYLDYVPNPEDFIETKEDLSEMKVEFLNIPEFTDYGTYSVGIKVSDIYGNETTGNCELMITWLIQEVNLELGQEFSVANIVIDAERFGALVPEAELAKVNNMVLGTYDINVDIEGKSYTSKVIVKDTTPPDLQLQNITIWDDEKVAGFESFIISANDISGEVKTESSTVIDYKIIGEQTITIKATDVNGNVIEQNAILTIKHDTTPPTVYGLSNLTVNKHSDINYESGVYAKDNKDGSVNFTVDSSSVNTSVAGTYYATYTSTDSAGNTGSYKRRIDVNWDSEDVNQKVTEFYNNYCAGKSAAEITQIVYSRIKYTTANYRTRNECIYYGLVNGRGNCFVHAYILQALINKTGSSCAVVWLIDGTHCWNKVGNIHYDSTPGGRHLLQANSDEEKLSEPWMAGKNYTADQFVVTY